MIDLLNSVFIDYCYNCDQHDWCTSHSQEKYFYYYNTLKQEIEREFVDLKVYANTDPYTGKKRTPALGALEVKFQQKIIFSKLSVRTWPAFDRIIDKIGAIKCGLNYSEADSNVCTQSREPRSKSNPRNPARGVSPQLRAQSRNNHRKLRVDQEIPLTEQSMFESRPRSRNDVINRRDYNSHLPSLNATFNKTTNEGRMWPKTKFYRRDKSPLRLHALKDAPFDAKIFRETGKVKNMSPSSEAKLTDTTAGETLKTMPNFTSYPVSSKFSGEFEVNKKGDISQKDLIDSLKFLRTSKPTPKRDPSKSRYSDNLANHDAIEYNLGENLEERNKEDSDKRPEPEPEESFSPEKNVVTRMKTEDIVKIEGEVRVVQALMLELEEDKGKNLDRNLSQAGFPPSPEALSNPVITCTTIKSELKEGNIHSTPKDTPRNRNTTQQSNNFPFDAVFPEKKVSVIQVAKDKGTKKKITIKGDPNADCIVKVHSSTPEILNMESNEIAMAKGDSAKISLKFRPQNEEKMEEFVLYLLKDDQPWLRIIIQAKYIYNI